MNGYRYFLTVVDEYSRFVFVEPVQSKNDSSSSLLLFIKLFKKQPGHTIRLLHSDGGGEFSRTRSTLESDEVKVTRTTPYTPQSNWLAERYRGIILSLASLCLHQAKLPMRYWEFALKHVADCQNFVPNSVTEQVPFETVFARAPSDISHLKPYGCRVLFRPAAKTLDTFAPHLIEGLCLFHEGGGVYRVLSDSGTVWTKHVRAFEKYFPGTSRLGTPYLDSDSDSGLGGDQEWSVSSADNGDTDRDDEEFRQQLPQHQAHSHTDYNPDVGEAIGEQAEQDYLTYAPAHPRTFGKSEDEDPDGDEDYKPSKSEQDIGATGTSTGQPSSSGSASGYNLRPSRNFKYTKM